MKMKKSIVRLTRRSFRRKLIMFGVSTFASLAITATGFAAWMLSADAMKETEGNVEVASVSDAGVEITDLVFDGADNFKFEPAAEDYNGRVRLDEDGNSERMSLRLTWTIKNYHNVAQALVEFKIPESVKTSMDKGYLALPSEFTPKLSGETHVTEELEGVKYYIYLFDASSVVKNNKQSNILSFTVREENGLTNVDFVLNLKFNWGADFEGVNPSIYYDTAYSDPTKGVGVAYADVKRTLIDLKASTYGVTDSNRDVALSKIANADLRESLKNKSIIEILSSMSVEEQNLFYNTIDAPTYKVVIHATVN